MSEGETRKGVLEAKRETKRRQIQALFDQQQAIQVQMDALHEELQLLDDEIDQIEEQQLEEEEEDDDGPFFVKEEPATATQTVDPQDLLTDPMTMTMHPDEFLTDVSQTQNLQGASAQYNDEGFLGRRSNFVGQLNLKPSSLVRKPQHEMATVRTGEPLHAEPPETFRRSTAGGAGFLTKPAASTRSVSTRLDSLQSLPTHHVAAPQDRGTIGPQPPHGQHGSNSYRWSHHIDHLLQHTFHLQQFRDNQREIIDATLSGNDVFVLMRTGGGKSLTYQLPALLDGSRITLVVSPLISLIRDQEDQMNSIRRNSALSFTSNIGQAEHTRRWNLVRNPNSGIVMIFVTPEKCHKSSKLRNELEKLSAQGRLSRFVIDECHCVSQYGHDFRPDYTKLGTLKRHFPNVPLLAVTATASMRVREDVARILTMAHNYRFFRSSARRDNLVYHVRCKTTKVLDDMAEFITSEHPTGAGIVYTFSRKEADTVAEQLCERGIVAASYHSSVPDTRKEAIHRSWMRNDTQVVVATIAFGLGINKTNTRFVLHHSLSKTLEAYYQESGRAGRDGEPADCVLYYTPKDVARMICMIHGESREQVFWQMARYAQAAGNDAVCKAIILKSLGEPGAADPEDVMQTNDGITTERKNLGRHAQTVTRLLQYKLDQGHDLTIPQLVKEWRSKKAPEFVKEHPPGKDLSVDECERIVITLIIEDVMSPKVVWTAYASNMYLKLGPLGNNLILSPDPAVWIRLPHRPVRKPTRKRTPKPASPANVDGWFDKKPKAKRKQPSEDTSTKRATSTKKRGSIKSARKRTTLSTKAKKRKKKEVIELLDLSSSDEENSPDAANGSSRVSKEVTQKLLIRRSHHASDEIDVESEEYEFDD